MKKAVLLSLLIMLCLVIALPVLAAETSGTLNNGKFTWRVENGTLYISGDGYISNWNSCEKVPWYPIRDTIENVVMTGKIINIPTYAFEKCSNLKNITFPDGVSVIFDSAFQECTSLESIVLPDTVDDISDNAFKGCTNLKRITMSKKLEEIGRDVFAGCNSLEEIHFSGRIPCYSGDKITNHAVSVYYPASNLLWDEASIAKFKNGFAEGTVFIGVGQKPTQPDLQPGEIRGGCGENLAWSLKDGVLTISGTGPMLNYGVRGLAPWFDYRMEITEVIIESGATTIGNDAFLHAENMTKVTLPETLQRINMRAFADCYKLESVVIPEGVTIIEESAFRSCNAIQELVIPASVTELDMEGMGRCAELKKLTLMGSPILKHAVPIEEIWCYADVPSIQFGFGINSSTVYYPAGNPSWTEERMASMGENITWKAFCANSHAYGEWVEIKAPTADEIGTAQRECSVCGATEQKDIPKLTQPEPQPTEPKPTEPTPTQPQPTEPEATEAPTQPSEPTPTQPEATQPQPTQPEPTQGEQKPTEPVTVDPAPVDETPWVAIVIAGVLILAGGGAAVWFFLVRKRK